MMSWRMALGAQTYEHHRVLKRRLYRKQKLGVRLDQYDSGFDSES